MYGYFFDNYLRYATGKNYRNQHYENTAKMCWNKLWEAVAYLIERNPSPEVVQRIQLC